MCQNCLAGRAIEVELPWLALGVNLPASLARLCTFWGDRDSVTSPENRFRGNDAQGFVERSHSAPKGADGSPMLLPQRPIEDFHLVVASNGTKPSNRSAGLSVEEGIPFVAPLGSHGGSAEWEGSLLNFKFRQASAATPMARP
jgi:hypothetical protein